jgi:acyl dehydratase
LIPEEILPYIGKMAPPQFWDVEKGAIRRYADAVGNPNPIHRDVEHAAKSRHGAIIAPPGFFGWPKQGGPVPELMREVIQAMAQAGYPGLLAGGMSYEFFLPIRAGDTIVLSIRVKDVYEREGKAGRKMLFAVFEKSYLNQNGDLVTRVDHTLIFR